MEEVLSWLNQPLLEDSFLRLWMAIAAGAVLVLAGAAWGQSKAREERL